MANRAALPLSRTTGTGLVLLLGLAILLNYVDRSAIAIAAVRPGIAPTNSPSADEIRMTKITQGSASSASAATNVSISRAGAQAGLPVAAPA